MLYMDIIKVNFSGNVWYNLYDRLKYRKFQVRIW